MSENTPPHIRSRYITGAAIITIFLVVGGYQFLTSTIEYVPFNLARIGGKKVQVKGVWVKEKGASFDPSANTFTFHLRDDEETEEKVIFEGAKPNNFDIATSVVVKGKYRDGAFHATEILTKCPSKYESNAPEQKTGSM